MDPPGTDDDTARRATKYAWIERACLAAAAVLLIAFRFHAFDLPLENDECNYAYTGARLLAGDRLYVDVWDHQPPGVFVLFAGVIALFGDAPDVFRWMTTLFSLGSMGLIYAILRCVSSRTAAVCGAVLFAVVSSDPGTAGEGCNREIYMNTLILAAWYLAMRPTSRRRVLLAGCALGLASSIKTVVAIHWLFLAVWIATRRTGVRARSLVALLVLFAAGPAILWLAVGGYFAATERWAEFIDAVFLFNLSYSGSPESFLVRFGRFFAPPRHPFIFDSAPAVWVGAVGAAAWLCVDGFVRRRAGARALLALILASYVAVCLPGRFWPHYYYLLVPPAVIAVSAALGQLVARLAGSAVTCPRYRRGMLLLPTTADPPQGTVPLKEHRHPPVRRSVRLRSASLSLFAVVPIAAFATQYRDYLSRPPFGITVKRYNSRDFWGRAQGRNVRRVTEPDDEIFVFGNDAEIYYYSGRRCASRFTMITGLQSGYAGAEERRRILLTELRDHPPRLIIVLFDEKPFDGWKAFLSRYYGEPIGWDYHDRTREPIMFVLARRDRPIETIDWDWDRSVVDGGRVFRRDTRSSGSRRGENPAPAPRHQSP